MEHSADPISAQPGVKWTNPFYLILALIIAFAAGLTLGFWGRPWVMPEPGEKIVEVVVTATPGARNEPTTQANPQPASPNAEGKSPSPTIMDFVLSDARHFRGSVNAPVTIVEFSDFKCTFCGRFFAETEPQLYSKYVDTGKVRFVYKHFAILGEESNRAAEASECAAEQGKFWEFHDQVFLDQTTIHSTLNDAKLIDLATEAGVETTSFAKCLASGRYTSQIGQESLTVQSMGARGTPAFLINGVFISGAQPFEVFQQVIEEQLKTLERTSQ